MDHVLLLIAATSVCFGCATVVESPSIEKHQTDDVDGTVAPYIDILQGRDGQDGRDGEPGLRGLQGRDGKVGHGRTWISWTQDWRNHLG